MFKNSIIYFFIRAINGALGLATVVILTRMMSPEQYGAYALGLATIALCASILYQWIAVTISRFYASHAANPEVLIAEGTSLFRHVSLLALVPALIYICVVDLSANNLSFNASILIGTIASGLHNLGLQISNASGRPLNYGLLTVTRAAFALSAAVGLVYLGYGSTGAIFGFAIGGVASVALFRIRHAKYIGANNKELRKQLIVYGLPLTLTYLSTMILDVSDRFMIGWWLGTPAVAGYAAAYDITQQVIGAIMNVLFLATYPRITTAWEAGSALSARNAILPLSSAMLLVMPLLAGIFIGGASEISRLAFDAKISSETAKIIPWVAFAITIGCFKSYYLDIAFQLNKNTKIQLYITVVMAAANLILNICLMPYLGVVGAAIATAAAFLIGAVLSWWFGRAAAIYSLQIADTTKAILVFLTMLAAAHLLPINGSNALVDIFFFMMFLCSVYFVGIIATNLVGVRSTTIKKLVFLFKRLHP